MEFLDLLNWLFDKFGAAALPWVAIIFLFWLVMRDRNAKTGITHEWNELVDDYHEAIIANTKALERLSVLLEERTRRQGR